MNPSSKVKAVFIGITYENMKTALPTPLGVIPFIYAKKFKQNLVLKGVFSEDQCVILTDWKTDFKMASKQNVIQALTDLITNADKSGDSLLFYFCGHGIAYQDPETKKFIQRNGHWGSLKTLNSDGNLVDEFFDTEFRAIVSTVAPKVNLSMFIHACHGGVMFVAPGEKPATYKGKGIALSAVDPTIPTAIENPSNTDFSTRRDFSVFLVEDVVKKLPEDKAKWPTYTEVYTVLIDRSKENPDQTGSVLMPVLYHDPSIDPSKCRLLSKP